MTATAVTAQGHAVDVVEVIRPGMLTTVQDLGRAGFGSFGVSPSGAMDETAHRVANLLVGNRAGAAALEVTGPGAAFRFVTAHTFALAGADLGATLSGLPLPPLYVGGAPAGAVLGFGTRVAGARATVAFTGGLVVQKLFGSAATDLGAGLGGLGAGPLRAGIRLAAAAPVAGDAWPTPAPIAIDAPAFAALGAHVTPTRAAKVRLRYVPEEAGGVPARVRSAFAKRTFRVSVRSNRTGFRFEGEPLATTADPDRLSEPTAPGALQLPPDGLPILLMADRNTTGGYPRLGHLASADRARAAQLWPGDEVTFVPTTLEAAVAAARRAEKALIKLLAALGC